MHASKNNTLYLYCTYIKYYLFEVLTVHENISALAVMLSLQNIYIDASPHMLTNLYCIIINQTK